jgi:hypothetical protein
MMFRMACVRVWSAHLLEKAITCFGHLLTSIRRPKANPQHVRTPRLPTAPSKFRRSNSSASLRRYNQHSAESLSIIGQAEHSRGPGRP